MSVLPSWDRICQEAPMPSGWVPTANIRESCPLANATITVYRTTKFIFLTNPLDRRALA
jgi:hypothetical protein